MIDDINDIELKCSWLGKIFNSFNKIKINNETVDLLKGDTCTQSIKISDIINLVTFEYGFFYNHIDVKTDQNLIRLKFIKSNKSDQFIDLLNSKIANYLNEKIMTLWEELQSLTVKQYPRDSYEDNILTCIKKIYDIVSNKKFDINLFSDDINNIINDLKEISSCSIKDFQKKYEDEKITERKYFYDKVESYPLTEEQRLGAIRNNDLNMVLAAAGTGKTSVLVVKVLDMIDQNICAPNEILVIAYNRAAAKELEERVQAKAQKINLVTTDKPFISTFHALGRYILRKAGIRPILSIFADDDMKLNQWITQWLHDYLHSDISVFFDMLNFFPEPYDPFDSNSETQHERYLRDNEFRTIVGEKVKGYEELQIANYLFLNGINYKYEEPYLTKRRLENNIDYRPDFHITDTNIYIEHFGIDRDGSTRKDIDSVKYNETIKKKRELHQQYKTRLIETYHYEWKEGTLFDLLKKKLLSKNITLKPRSTEEIQKYIDENKQRISSWAEILIKCLHAIRYENLDKSGILSRLESAKIYLPKKKAELLYKLLNDYKKELLNQNAIDFDDMILKATEFIDLGTFTPKWKYIFVDEFQDISMSRMSLIKSIMKNSIDSSLTVVGDDWQAIYRFSGGKLELTTRFEEFVGKCTLTKLQKTFRYNNSIADISEKFIMENPEQIKKHIETHDKVKSPQVFILDSFVNGKEDLYRKTIDTLNYIKNTYPNKAIAIIARYNFLLNDLKQMLNRVDTETINFWKFHKSKGLEADYTILIGLNKGKLGFPSENKDDAIVEALLPLLDGYPHSEERRLMYVGLTRAKKQAYLIADPTNPSAFIDELLSAWYKIEIKSSYFTQKFRDIYKCPYCTDGYLRKFKGSYGEYYLCNSDIGCPVGKARVCPVCGSPSIDMTTESRCTNKMCGHSFPICEICGRPMRVRNGKFGKFLGCSGYGIASDQCKNTRKLS